MGVGVEDVEGFVWGFVEEIDAEVGEACGAEIGEVAGAGLGDGIEERVAAAGVCFERVFHADAVAEGDLMVIAGSAAVEEGGARGHEGGEDTVLHMEHGHVLVEDELEP